MRKIKACFLKKSYNIYISFDLFEKIKNLKINNKIMIVTNNKISNLYLNYLINFLNKKNKKILYTIIPDGEKFKNLSTANTIFTNLLKYQYGRDTTLIALGGGVVGDITGFVASTYQRGIDFIQIPTTLLSQVDASIGGKTAVNHDLGKNMIGSFYQPSKVLINLNFLKSLPEREIKSGMAEIIKYAIVYDNTFFNWINEHYSSLLKLHKSTIEYCVHRCCIIKNKIVQEDEYENNSRALLNLGHTYGHAIEAFMNYNNAWLHGEAVSVGIVMATNASLIMKKISQNDADKIISLIKKLGLPIKGPNNMKANDFFSKMKIDKKVLSGKLRFILPIKIGKAEIYDNIEKKIILKSIKNCI